MNPKYKLSEKASQIYHGLQEKAFGIKDIGKFENGITRQLRYWISLGMVDGLGTQEDNPQELGWNKFNFYEFIWILIIKELKNLNFDNSIIAKCAIAIQQRKDKNQDMLEFEKAVFYSLMRREPVLFTINMDGEFGVYIREDFSNVFGDGDLNTFVVINLLTMIKEFFSKSEFMGFISEKKLLQANELNVLGVLGKCKSINIRNEEMGTGFNIPGGDSSYQDFINSIFVKDYKNISISIEF